MTAFPPQEPQGRILDELLPPTYNGNSTGPFADRSGDGGPDHTVGVLMLALFALLINLVLFLPPFLVRRRRRRQQQERRIFFQAAGSGAQVIGGESKDVRYYKIESWVVSKQISPHDEVCEKVYQLNALDKKPRLRKQTVSTVESVDTEEGDEEMASSPANATPSDDSSEEEAANERECPICFDTFEVGDVASWSADPACKHVFHHRCIKEWLINHKGCPYCRETFLPVDRLGSNTKFTDLSELIVAQEQRSLHCYYCVDHGIVYTPKDLVERLDKPDCAEVSQRAREVPERSILYCLRGAAICQDCDIESGIVGAGEAMVHNTVDHQEAPIRNTSTVVDSEDEATDDHDGSDDPASPSIEDEQAA